MKRLMLQKTDTYGIEIEFTSNRRLLLERDFLHLKKKKILHPDWEIKRENSCDCFEKQMVGLEINSPIMSQHKYWLQELKVVLKELEKMTQLTESCAIHFHIGKQIFEDNVSYLQNLLLLWCYYEEVIFRFSSGEYDRLRKGIDSFARPLNISLSDSQIMDLKHCPDLYVFLKHMSYDVGRILAVNLLPYYYAVKHENFGSTWKKQTVEFRTFAATYQYELIYHYLDMILNMIQHAKEMDAEERQKYYHALMTRDEYIDINCMTRKQIPFDRYFGFEKEKAEEFAKLIYADEKKQKQFMKIYTCKSKSYEE